MSGAPHSSLAGCLPAATLQDIIRDAFLTFVAETRLELRPAASPAAFAAAFLSDQRVTPFPTWLDEYGRPYRARGHRRYSVRGTQTTTMEASMVAATMTTTQRKTMIKPIIH